MLKALHGTTNAHKESLFLREYSVSVSVKMFKSNTIFFLIWMKQNISFALLCLHVKCSLESGSGDRPLGLWLLSAKSKDSAVEFNKAISQSGELEAKALSGSQRALYVEEGWRTSSPSHTVLAWKHVPFVSTSAVSHWLAWCQWLIRGLLWSERCLENIWYFLSWCLNVSLLLVISFCPSVKCCLLWD